MSIYTCSLYEDITTGKIIAEITVKGHAVQVVSVCPGTRGPPPGLITINVELCIRSEPISNWSYQTLMLLRSCDRIEVFLKKPRRRGAPLVTFIDIAMNEVTS
jgi:hypothetical protein